MSAILPGSRSYHQQKVRTAWLPISIPWPRGPRSYLVFLSIIGFSVFLLSYHGMSYWYSSYYPIFKENAEDTCFDVSTPSSEGATGGYKFDPFHAPFTQTYLPFLYAPPLSQTRLVVEPELTPATDIPAHCLDAYFSTGAPCFDATKSKLPIDVVWTWVNGSDTLHQMTYKTDTKVAGIDGLINVKLQGRPVMEPQAKLFRDHDELRYSMRSVLKNFRSSASQFILLASDFTFPSCSFNSSQSSPSQESTVDPSATPWRLGQLPQWLKMDLFQRWKASDIPLRVKHHANLFGFGFGEFSGTVYNSLAIESQLGNLDGVSENFVYMNDDLYFAKPLSPPDFYTQPYGLVLRMQANLLVNYEEQIPMKVAGEWRTLQYTNRLLSKRFGSRHRPYLAHEARSLSLSLLKEASHSYAPFLLSTSLKKFRGTPQTLEVYTIYLVSQFIIERWREALLWSWVVGKLGGDFDEWSSEQASVAWKEVGGMEGEEKVVVKREFRSTLVDTDVEKLLKDAGYDGPRSTKYVFSSQDGYPYAGLGRNGFGIFPELKMVTNTSTTSYRGSPPGTYTHLSLRCTMVFEECLGTTGNGGRQVRASDVFKRVAFEKVECGDCIISALVTASGPTGLSAFFAPSSRSYPHKYFSAPPSPIPPHRVPHLPLVGDWQIADFSLRSVLGDWGDDVNVREWSMRLAQRYRFVLGNTPSTFMMIKEPVSAKNMLAKIDLQPDIALICLNDDVVRGEEIVNEVVGAWQKRRWGEKAEWEV